MLDCPDSTSLRQCHGLLSGFAHDTFHTKFENVVRACMDLQSSMLWRSYGALHGRYWSSTTLSIPEYRGTWHLRLSINPAVYNRRSISWRYGALHL